MGKTRQNTTDVLHLKQEARLFLPGESQGRGSLVGYHLWGRTELDTTDMTWQADFKKLA